LPGMDGLEMTRLIKQDERTRDIAVVALTAFAMKGDEEKAMDAGCDGYITKPIDTRTLGDCIRQVLTQSARSDLPPDLRPAGLEALPAAEMQPLRRRFVLEGQELARQLLLDLDDTFDARQAARTVHQWVGTGGLLGYTALARLAREVESLLLERPVDTGQVRESLTNLLLTFSTPNEAVDASIPSALSEALSGKCVAIVDLPASETQRLCVALERARAKAIFFESAGAADRNALAHCDLVVTYVRPGRVVDPSSAVAGCPNIFVGNHDVLMALGPAVQAMTAEFLMDSWQPEEALVRLGMALMRGTPRHARAAPPVAAGGRIRVLLADDDPIVLSQVRTALENYGIEGHVAVDGLQALEAARRLRPQVAILDVNMPGMDGYEVLTAIRRDNLPVRVVLLTARRQESDIVRGFTLGADDYMVKPFSAMELVARLQRLVLR